jgi:protein-S-isoprenylcysteine O-methyltransferase Ste14
METTVRTPANNRSLGDLVSNLTQDMSRLIRLELQLAQAELTQTATKAGKQLAYIAVGGAIAYAGFLAILAGMIVLLAFVVPLWVSALIVGVVIAGIGLLLVQTGRSGLQDLEPVPERTVATLKEDKEWVKERVQ